MALVGGIAAGLSWLDDKLSNIVTKQELQIMHLDIRISMDEKTLSELDYILDSGNTFTAKQKRTYDQLKLTVPAMTTKRHELMGL